MEDQLRFGVHRWELSHYELRSIPPPPPYFLRMKGGVRGKPRESKKDQFIISVFPSCRRRAVKRGLRKDYVDRVEFFLDSFHTDERR